MSESRGVTVTPPVIKYLCTTVAALEIGVLILCVRQGKDKCILGALIEDKSRCHGPPQKSLDLPERIGVSYRSAFLTFLEFRKFLGSAGSLTSCEDAV